MNKTALHAQLQSITTPLGHTLQEEKALQQATMSNDTVQIALSFGYPILDWQNTLQQSIAATLKLPADKVKLTLTQNIHTHKVKPGLTPIAGVKNIIAVGSGKGGVGKSSTSAALAHALQHMGAKVGVLDADIYGPSQTLMMGVYHQKPVQEAQHFLPVVNESGIQVMSMGFLINESQAVIWRGPMISRALHQLLFQTAWQEIDYLIIDLPPGTGDVQLTLSQKIPVTGAIVVTTPQDVALIDARKAVDMFNKMNIPVLGVVENMSVHICSKCGHHEALFGAGGGDNLSRDLNVPLLAKLPLSLALRQAADAGQLDVFMREQTDFAALYLESARLACRAIAQTGRDYSARFGKIHVTVEQSVEQ